MRKYFYFRDTADEADDDDISKSVAIPVDAVTGIVPTAITTLNLYFAHEGSRSTQFAILTVTRGKLQEVCAAIAQAANAYPHNPGLHVVADIMTTTNGASSIQGDDKTVAARFTHPDITSVALKSQQP
jgi:RNase P/RNase MRP subunit POP5